ncbi:FkbM family methyltransferase [Bacteroides sp.]|uniref:FkbM family methyltransferase n=1 Tax=Bacteroides sp. TaxID=29523 RepID=UPI0026220264|nr:FkbM family methyltransferase [Bacteroides sp.]MDD3039569.1 FkbM family methyltransferase [Bacteroides sp.]
MNKQSITLGIISYNEGALMERLLNQLAEFVDEIIVVDSFSTDNTHEIISRFKHAKLFNSTIRDNFALIRNEVIAHSSSDYILMMDCDELLENPEVFFKQTFTEDAYMFPRKNYVDGEFMKNAYPDYQGRLFKNNGKIKYERAVHEVLYGYTNIIPLAQHLFHHKSREKFISNDSKYRSIINNGGNGMSIVDMSDDTIFKGWYQYEQFPNGAASRWCSDNGSVTIECADPSIQAIGIYISTVGKFKQARLTAKAGRKVVGKLDFEPERGTYFIPVNVSDVAPATVTLNIIKCWDTREYVNDPRTLGLFVDRIWTEAPGTIADFKVLFEPDVKLTIKGDAHDNGIMPCIVSSGYWETATQKVIDKFVTTDDVCLDVGANIGAIAIPLALRAKKVFAFEVGNVPYGYLCRNILENNLTNIEVVKGAVANEPGKLYYYYTYPNVGGSFVSTEKHSNSNGLTEEIEAFALDSMIDRFDRVDFIKMDIEGYELNALNGAVELLKKFSPKLYIEFNPVAFKNMHGNEIKPLWDFLANTYPYIYVVRDWNLRRVTSYEEVMSEIDFTTRTLEDLLCLNEEYIE